MTWPPKNFFHRSVHERRCLLGGGFCPRKCSIHFLHACIHTHISAFMHTRTSIYMHAYTHTYIAQKHTNKHKNRHTMFITHYIPWFYYQHQIDHKMQGLIFVQSCRGTEQCTETSANN